MSARTAGTKAYQCRRPSSGSAAATAGPVAGARPAQVEPWPRETATRSPRTALLVAGPPAPGPASRTVPSGSASISTRLVTPSVQPNGLSDGMAVGMTAASIVAVAPRRGRQQLDGQPERGGALHLLVGHAGDAGPAVAAGRRRSAADRGRIQPDPEREAGQDHELVDGIVALDVAARVGLRVAQLLGVGEDLVVRPAVLGHRGEDVVGRAVDDAADPPDLVGGEVAGERREDRDAAGDRGLEAQRRARPAGDRLQLRAVMGDDVLVRGHDRLAGPERGRDERPGRLVAAHDLDDDVGVRVGHEVGRGVGEERGGQAGLARSVEVADRDPGHVQRGPVRAGEALRVRGQAVEDGAADGARPEHADAQRRTAHERAG